MKYSHKLSLLLLMGLMLGLLFTGVALADPPPPPPPPGGGGSSGSAPLGIEEILFVSLGGYGVSRIRSKKK